MNIHKEVNHCFSNVLKCVSAGEITWLSSSLLVEVNGSHSKALRSTTAEMQPRARIECFCHCRCTEWCTGEVKVFPGI